MVRLAVLALLIVIGFCRGSLVSAAQQTLTLQEYIAELDRCSQTLADSGNDSASLRNLHASLPESWTVKSEAATYTVSTDWLGDAIATIEINPSANKKILADTQAKLAAYRDAARSMQTAESAQPIETQRATLNGILAAKEFRSMHGPSWLDIQKARLYAWLTRWLEKLLGHFGRPRAIGNAIAWIMITLAGLLMLLWAVQFSMRGRSQQAMDLSGAPAAPRGWQHWLREALDAASRGDYRSAIHAAYWAAIAHLEESHSLLEDRSRTPRESLKLIRRESSNYAPLSDLTRRFELVWYGYRSASAADWNDAMQQLETLGCLRSSMPAISGS